VTVTRVNFQTESITTDGRVVYSNRAVDMAMVPRVGDTVRLLECYTWMRVVSVTLDFEVDGTVEWRVFLEHKHGPLDSHDLIRALKAAGFEVVGNGAYDPDVYGSGGRRPLSPRVRYEVIEAAGFRCQACGRGASDGTKLHVDHIVPVAGGGSNDETNLQCLCEECNLGKGAG
jgi:hypothetical protein